MRKFVVNCATPLAGGLLLKILKYFEVMLNIFESSYVKEVVESWLVYVNKFSWISNHVSWPKKQNKVSASFFFLWELLWEENKF